MGFYAATLIKYSKKVKLFFGFCAFTLITYYIKVKWFLNFMRLQQSNNITVRWKGYWWLVHCIIAIIIGHCHLNYVHLIVNWSLKLRNLILQRGLVLRHRLTSSHPCLPHSGATQSRTIRPVIRAVWRTSGNTSKQIRPKSTWLKVTWRPGPTFFTPTNRYSIVNVEIGRNKLSANIGHQTFG